MKPKEYVNQPSKWPKKLKGNNVKLFNILLFMAFIFSGCFNSSTVYKSIPNYNGPKITKIVVNKSQRKLFLFNKVKIFSFASGCCADVNAKFEIQFLRSLMTAS